ncbi:GNAT family N-acetyltransferase [candidate division WOR-3 bacterium]|nr:GNAT family N-acetyltransferase [candidate division WOR-3 bacterium]
MPICRDLDRIRLFVERYRPATNSIANLIDGKLGSSVRWIRADDPQNPRALLCRTRRFTLFAVSDQTAIRVLAETPRNMRMAFRATPTRFYRLIRKHWRGPDAGRRVWHNHCYMYVLKPGRLVVDRTHQVSPLRPADAAVIARSWPYGRSPDHVLGRILSGPGCCIRHNGALAAWALTHDDGSMGFLHVVEKYRGRGMARTLTTALAERMLLLGIQPFVYILATNKTSIRLTAGMGFSRAGRFSWFATS